MESKRAYSSPFGCPSVMEYLRESQRVFQFGFESPLPMVSGSVSGWVF